MTAHVKILRVEPATGHPAFSYLVELDGDGRGLYAAVSSEEAEELVLRINNFPALYRMADMACIKIARLKKQLRKLRQAQRKGGAK